MPKQIIKQTPLKLKSAIHVQVFCADKLCSSPPSRTSCADKLADANCADNLADADGILPNIFLYICYIF